jgi:hypothetical protein
MMRDIQRDELEPLATGAWILGAGGGGNPYLSYANVRGSIVRDPQHPAAAPAIPAGLPPEFDLYIRALIDHYSARAPQARAQWNTLLSRPEADRHWRSVWAAFMIGKSFLHEDPGASVIWFQKARALAATGFSDNLGLAASSLGWEARAELDQGHFTRATDLYLDHLASGDPTALMSIRLVAARIADSDPRILDSLAAHLPTQRLITAYITARGGPIVSFPRPLTPTFTRAWLAALERTPQPDPTGADRIAWAAYQNGDFDATDRWLKLADQDAPLSLWLRAKLLLRAGKLDDAAALLARASHAFPATETWGYLGEESEDTDFYAAVVPARQSLGEAGVVLLSRRHYTEALDSLLRARFWGDAAYIAERVLTVDELKTYIDRTSPAEKVDTAGTKQLDLRYLLARRLVRLHRFDDARPYMPEQYRDKLARLAASYRTGHDQKLPAPRRADALWEAALITRVDGLELLGTELEPDAGIYGAEFDIDFNRTPHIPPHPHDPPSPQIVPPSQDELVRFTSTATDPDRRFHYRYLAADLAWQAAALMPDNDEATATILCTAGTWLKALDPKKADRFYKTLVERCPNTDLGKQAAQLHWFPKLDDWTK